MVREGKASETELATGNPALPVAVSLQGRLGDLSEADIKEALSLIAIPPNARRGPNKALIWIGLYLTVMGISVGHSRIATTIAAGIALPLAYFGPRWVKRWRKKGSKASSPRTFAQKSGRAMKRPSGNNPKTSSIPTPAPCKS
jgi:hypothetical protein